MLYSWACQLLFLQTYLSSFASLHGPFAHATIVNGKADVFRQSHTSGEELIGQAQFFPMDGFYRDVSERLGIKLYELGMCASIYKTITMTTHPTLINAAEAYIYTLYDTATAHEKIPRIAQVLAELERLLSSAAENAEMRLPDIVLTLNATRDYDGADGLEREIDGVLAADLRPDELQPASRAARDRAAEAHEKYRGLIRGPPVKIKAKPMPVPWGWKGWSRPKKSGGKSEEKDEKGKGKGKFSRPVITGPGGKEIKLDGKGEGKKREGKVERRSEEGEGEYEVYERLVRRGKEEKEKEKEREMWRWHREKDAPGTARIGRVTPPKQDGGGNDSGGGGGGGGSKKGGASGGVSILGNRPDTTDGGEQMLESLKLFGGKVAQITMFLDGAGLDVILGAFFFFFFFFFFKIR